jgi:hypothetical protein
LRLLLLVARPLLLVVRLLVRVLRLLLVVRPLLLVVRPLLLVVRLLVLVLPLLLVVRPLLLVVRPSAGPIRCALLGLFRASCAVSAVTPATARLLLLLLAFLVWVDLVRNFEIVFHQPTGVKQMSEMPGNRIDALRLLRPPDGHADSPFELSLQLCVGCDQVGHFIIIVICGAIGRTIRLFN